MDNMIDYLKKYGNVPFSKKPLNDVDSLVLSQLSYLKFDHLVPSVTQNEPFLSIHDLDACKENGNLFADERYAKDNRELFEEILSGPRFGTIKLNYYVNEIDIEKETQFSAVTYALEDESYYVAFRGTDETIVGWKEDFNLAFSKPARGQINSVKYLDYVGKQLKNSFYVGGHSKGGNFAVYASMNCKSKIQDRIRRIYSHDGPGFRPEVMEAESYEKIASRIRKIIPHSSMIGMLLESHENYKVIESKTFGLMQHNPYTWRVKDDHFMYVDDIYSGRKFIDHTLNEWILSLTEEQIHAFIEVLFTVIEASDTDNLIDFTADLKKSMSGVLAAIKEIDEESRKVIGDIIRALFEMASERMKQEIQCRTEEGLLKLSEKAEENKAKYQEKAVKNQKMIRERKGQRPKKKAGIKNK